MPVKILAIGKGTQDVFMRSNEFDPHTRGKKVYTELPLGLKMEVEDVIFSTGGNATNVATTFARQGLDSRYMWALGEDSASQAVIAALDAEGVDTRDVLIDSQMQAGYSVILIATNGERTILNHRGRTFGTDVSRLNLRAISQVDWIYPTSLADNSLTVLRAVLDEAERAGTKVMLNPAGPELADPAKLKGLLDSVDVLCTNKEEMQMLVEGQTLEELALKALHYVPVVIVSDGPNGVVATDGKTIVQAGMYEDVPVIDRTGAGDAFASGFLSQWAQGASLRDSIIFASANSTSVVAQIGAKGGILHRGASLHTMPITEKPIPKRG